MATEEMPHPHKPPGWTFPLNETYIAFGDGSVTPAGTFYGLVLVPERAIEQLQGGLSAIKLKHGGTENASIHCRELFSGDARQKTPWAHLSEQQVMALCGDTLLELKAHEPKFLLAHFPSACYPKRFRLRGKNGHSDLVHELDDKWLTLWTYFRIASAPRPCGDRAASRSSRRTSTPKSPLLADGYSTYGPGAKSTQGFFGPRTNKDSMVLEVGSMDFRGQRDVY